MRPNKTGYLSSPKLPENIILSNYSNKPRVDKKKLVIFSHNALRGDLFSLLEK